MTPLINHILTNYYGIREVEGMGYSPTILKWIRQYFPEQIDDSVIPNCSICLIESAKELGYDNLLTECTPAAKSWLLSGKEVLLEESLAGDIVVLSRIGGNHVGILIRHSEFRKSVFLLGFNQNNQCNITEYKQTLIKGIRRYEFY